jgi:hypothetical protein
MPLTSSTYTSLETVVGPGLDRVVSKEQLESFHAMFVGCSMKFVYAFFVFVVYVNTQHISMDWSVILTLGSIFQTLGWYALLHKIMRQKSVAGVSMYTVEMLMVAYAVRLWSTMMKSGYLPMDSSGDGVYQAADLIGLGIAYGTWQCITETHKGTYEWHLDTLDLRSAMPVCVVLAVLIHGDLNDCFFFDSLYYVSINVETLAMMPQLWMFTKGGGQVDGMTSHFVVMHTLGRLCSLLFWWDAVGEIGRDTKYNLAGKYLILSLLLQVLQALDFMYYYMRARLTGEKMVLPGL